MSALSRNRVVALGMPLPPDAIARFRKGAKGVRSTAFGRRITLDARFEPKLGGGGHVVFSRADRPDAEDRLVVEPATFGWDAAALVIPADYRRDDDVYESVVREWLRDAFGLIVDGESLKPDSKGGS